VASAKRTSTLGRDSVGWLGGQGHPTVERARNTMFTYRCPACGKQHLVDAAFGDAYDAACLRCREIIHVTKDLIYATPGTETMRPPGKRAGARLTERFQPAATLSVSAVSDSDTGTSAKQDVGDAVGLEKSLEAQWADQEPESRSDPDRNPDSGDKVSNGKTSKGK